MKRIAFTVGFISIAIIAFELALMRILSIAQFHHFAYMIISVALLGFGASGTFLSVYREKLLERFEKVIFLFSILCSSTMILSMGILNYISFDPFLIIWDISKGWSLLLFYLAIFLPFFFGAVVICISFMKFTEKINQIYFYNLFGSALGGVIILGLMFIFDSTYLPAIVSAIALVSGILSFTFLKNKTVPGFLIIINLLIILAFLIHPIKLKMSEYKSLSKSLHLLEAKIIDNKFSPLGELTTVTSPVLRYAPGLSFGYTGDIPPQTGLFSDGEWIGTIIKNDSNEKINFLNYSTSVLPYVLKKKSNVLVIGAGTGTEIRAAIQNGARKITGIELNPQVIEIAKQNFADNVKLINAEGRGYLNQSKEKFDIITIPILEGFSASAAGMYALFENYLFTIESFSLMIDHLKVDGIMAINTWLNFPPRHAIKMFGLLVESLEEFGIKNPSQHIVSIRSWGTVISIVKKTSFNLTEIETIKKFCKQNYFDLIYYPGISEEETNIYHQLESDLFYISAQEILSSEREKFFLDYKFNVIPPRDNKPYFSHFLQLKSLPYLTDILGKESVTFLEWGYIILIITLFQIIFISILLIIIPLYTLKREQINWLTKLRTILYFAGLGIGFMLIEIVLIQKFILFLSHPIYSVSVVITALLIFSGIGSWYSTKITGLSAGKLRVVILIIVFLAFLYTLILPEIFNFMIHLQIWLKYLISILVVSPLAFFMGMPFPVGLKRLSNDFKSMIPWAWGVNGCLSVISAVLVPFLAMEFGFTSVILLAGLSYSLIIIIGGKF